MKKIKSLVIKYRQAIITVALLVLLAGAVLVINRGHGNNKDNDLNKVVSAVSKLMLLPADETPNLATITDSSKLSNKAVFNGSKDGDRVLIYTKAQEIIIYRPGIDKIVAVRPFIADKKGSPYITSNIAILNGSGNNDALAKMTKSVTSAYPNSTIVLKDNAPRDFPHSIIIDLTRKNQPLDEQIADSLGIKAGQLPLGVTVEDADFLIIIGQDYK